MAKEDRSNHDGNGEPELYATGGEAHPASSELNDFLPAVECDSEFEIRA